MTYGAAFLKATAERAIGAFCGPLVFALTADGTDLFHVRWKAALGTAAGAALLSVLASIVKATRGPEGPGMTETTRGAGRIGDP